MRSRDIEWLSRLMEASRVAVVALLCLHVSSCEESREDWPDEPREELREESPEEPRQEPREVPRREKIPIGGVVWLPISESGEGCSVDLNIMEARWGEGRRGTHWFIRSEAMESGAHVVRFGGFYDSYALSLSTQEGGVNVSLEGDGCIGRFGCEVATTGSVISFDGDEVCFELAVTCGEVGGTKQVFAGRALFR